MSRNVSVFDDCNLSNVKIYLNSILYLYDDLNPDFGRKKYVVFNMYAHFRKTLWIQLFRNTAQCAHLSRKILLWSLIARDKMNPSRTSLWMYAEFDCKENMPVKTTAYCLIIPDRVLSVVQCSLQDYVNCKNYLEF